jgi:hypothetical protein
MRLDKAPVFWQDANLEQVSKKASLFGPLSIGINVGIALQQRSISRREYREILR